MADDDLPPGTPSYIKPAKPVDPQARELSPIGLYSHASEVADRLPQMKGTPQQFAAMLQKQGVKPDELKHSGYDQAFKDQKLVTKQQLAQHFRSKIPKVQETVLGSDLKYKSGRDLAEASGDDWGALGPNGRQQYDDAAARPATKYSGYQLPGGKNYREVLLHLPPKYGTWNNGAPVTDEEIATDHGRETAARVAGYSDDTYNSSHWDTPNVLAHLRMSDRKGPKGEKILHLEELQSDWAQEGRKGAFKDPAREQELRQTFQAANQRVEDMRTQLRQKMADTPEIDAKLGPLLAAREEAQGALFKVMNGVPAAPYVDSTQKWVDLGLKRVLHEAAKGGYDKVVVTPGEEQAKRYDLSQHISDIYVKEHEPDRIEWGYRRHGSHDWSSSQDDIHPDKLASHIGKEAAEKILKKPPDSEGMRHLSGLDLKVGGEGMKAFYDKLVPAALEKLAKKHDPQAKVELNKDMVGPDEKPPYHDRQALEKHLQKARRVHALTITPEMRKSILRGHAAFAEGGPVMDQQPQVAPVVGHPARIPTRLVTSKVLPSEPHHTIDMESFRADPKLFAKNMELVRSYPNMREGVARKANHEQLATEFIRHAKDNLLALHDAVPEEVRNRSKLWYTGARNIIDRWSKDYNLPDHSIAGAIAALSPQKDWYQNVSLAKRILDVMRGSGGNYYNGFATSPEMEKKFKGTKTLHQYKDTFNLIKGKTLADIDALDMSPREKLATKALWVRLHDEAHNDRGHQIVSPEGEFGEKVKTQKGAEAGTGWGSLGEISKAIAAIEAADDPAKLSGLMGERHKVRNFYNNMLDPDGPGGDVTIDTHAVAAGLYRPLSGNSLEVSHNFANHPGKGLPAAGGSAMTGVQGLYPLYAEAYRQAAKERGILPREMQSITWEAIRGQFPDTFKTKANNDMIDNVWLQYRKGKISQSRAREKIHAIAGRVRNPTWFPGDDEAQRHPGYTGELPSVGLRGPLAEGAVGRAGGRPAGDLPTGPPRAAVASPGSQIGLISPQGTFAHGGVINHALRITRRGR